MNAGCEIAHNQLRGFGTKHSLPSRPGPWFDVSELHVAALLARPCPGHASLPVGHLASIPCLHTVHTTVHAPSLPPAPPALRGVASPTTRKDAKRHQAAKGYVVEARRGEAADRLKPSTGMPRCNKGPCASGLQ